MSNRRVVRINGDENGVGPKTRSDGDECSTNRVAVAKFITKCSLHFVTTNVVIAMILETIKCVALYATRE